MTDPYDDATPGDGISADGGTFDPTLAERIEATRRRADVLLGVQPMTLTGVPDQTGFVPGQDRIKTAPEMLADSKAENGGTRIMNADGSVHSVIPDITTYDEQTLFKVRDGLRQVLGSEQVITDCIAEMQNQGILFRERYDGPRGDVSDGNHTFDELYDHRRKLTAVLATIGSINGDSWRSKRHHPEDGPMFDGSFIVGIELPGGPISYHYPLDSWDEFVAVPELEHAPKWDGAGPAETLERLTDFTAHLKEAIDDGHVVQQIARAAADTVVETAGSASVTEKCPPDCGCRTSE